MTEKALETIENPEQRQQAWPLPEQKPVAAPAATARKSSATPKVVVATPDVAACQPAVMQLQVNNSGAWKTVLRFARSHISAVRILVQELHRLGDQASSWRITDCANAQPTATQAILTSKSGFWANPKGRNHD